MTQYRKLPVVIEAVQYTGTNAEEIKSFIQSESWKMDVSLESIVIVTLEGDMTVSVDDFVIKGVQGEFYPCKPDIFMETYEEVN